MNEDRRTEIDNAQALYDVGDYREARKTALRLKEDEHLKKEEKERLEHILRATRSDPVAITAMIFTLFVIIFIVLKYAF